MSGGQATFIIGAPGLCDVPGCGRVAAPFKWSNTSRCYRDFDAARLCGPRWVLYEPPLMLKYRMQRSNPVMTGLDPVIFIGWLLTGIASFAIWCGRVMAGSSPAMTGVESRYFRRLELYQPPLMLRYRMQRSNPVMTGLDPVIFIGWLLTGLVSFAIWCGHGDGRD
jgi:hypothetical protein